MQWKIDRLDCYPEYEGQQNVVTTAHWELTEDAARVYGTAVFTLNPEADFIPFEELTEATVIGWVQAVLGEETVAAYEAAITAQLEAIANPPIITPALPW